VARHIQTLGILWIIVGAFWLIPAILMMVLGSVAHAFIPFGSAVGRALGPAVLHATALGIYTLWVLLPSDAAQEYTQMARVA
jgi:hypothetical protein